MTIFADRYDFAVSLLVPRTTLHLSGKKGATGTSSSAFWMCGHNVDFLRHVFFLEKKILFANLLANKRNIDGGRCY
jgi:hypothetical protein